MTEYNDRLRELVADVAAAYFSNSHVAPSDIPSVVNQIASSLQSVGSAEAAPEAQVEADAAAAPKLTAAQIRKSVTPNGLISFEDNKSYKTLRRHLATRGLSPEQYRAKWSLPSDYPMVAPAYSAARSAMAKSLGLGRKPGSAATSDDMTSDAPAKPKAARGRPRKVA